MIKARKIVKSFKPNFAVGVGGYASGPMLRAVASRGIPCLIQEQNSYAGVTNKLLANHVKTICVAYDKMERFFPASKIVFTGNPVRREIVEMNVTREQGIAEFKLDPNKKTLLIVGGSLGARTINESILAMLDQLKQMNIQVLWQTGKFYYDEVVKVAEKYENVCVNAFISRMDLAYSAADVIVSRAGAGTISELCIVGKPCIFVPSPNVTEDHQTKNAMALVEKNAALMVRDADAKMSLITTIAGLFADEEKMNLLAKNIKALEIKNSAELIVNELLKLKK